MPCLSKGSDYGIRNIAHVDAIQADVLDRLRIDPFPQNRLATLQIVLEQFIGHNYCERHPRISASCLSMRCISH